MKRYNQRNFNSDDRHGKKQLKSMVRDKRIVQEKQVMERIVNDVCSRIYPKVLKAIEECASPGGKGYVGVINDVPNLIKKVEEAFGKQNK